MTLLLWSVGLLTGICAVKIYEMVEEKRIQCKWYHWLVGALWYFAGLFIIVFIGTTIWEGEPQAAGMATFIFGGAFLVISVLLYRFVVTKQIIKTTV